MALALLHLVSRVVGLVALAALAVDERYGVWGGLTAAERERRRRRRA